MTSMKTTVIRLKYTLEDSEVVCSAVTSIKFVCSVSYSPPQQLGYIEDGSQEWRLTILRAATHETERGDHGFCLSRSHYTDTDPPVGSGRPELGSKLGPPHQESRALPTELSPPPLRQKINDDYLNTDWKIQRLYAVQWHQWRLQ